MNYVVVYKKGGVTTSLFFAYKDESDRTFKDEILIKNEDDVIKIMLDYIHPDDDSMVIRETLLDFASFKEANTNIINRLSNFLNNTYEI